MSCHVDRHKAFQGAKHIHEPALSKCTACHQSHGGDFPALLREESPKLCLSCHEPIAKEIATAKTVHGADPSGENCSKCHVPHSSNVDHLLTKPRKELCVDCHKQTLSSSGGEITILEAELEGAKSIHAPVREGECNQCHRPHSSTHDALLIADRPSAFYVQYSEAEYEFCFQCHDRRLVSEEKTNRTQFRNGDQNLHFLHVTRRRGRACHVCHATHGSENPKLMKSGTPFGPSGWILPIGFDESEEGGTCGPGCHREVSYDNRTPPPPPDEELEPRPPGDPMEPPTSGGESEPSLRDDANK
jgi:predicted CXXCH cytochrome family protein